MATALDLRGLHPLDPRLWVFSRATGRQLCVVYLSEHKALRNLRKIGCCFGRKIQGRVWMEGVN